MTTMKVDFDKYLDIDVDNGICIWKDTIQSHRELIGREAGSKIKSRGKEYWVISIGGKDGYGNDWPVTVYVCKKCQKKILKKLGLHLEKKE